MKVRLFCLVLVAVLFVYCHKKTETEIITVMMTDMAVQAEKRDVSGLIANLANDFMDFQGRDRNQIAEIQQEYFSRYRGIVIHVLASRIVIEDARNATVETDVALSSGAAQAFRKLIRFSGENYRFKFRLRKDGRWLIKEAAWEFIQMDSLFPESLKILRGLFPNL